MNELNFWCHGAFHHGRNLGAVALDDEPADECCGCGKRDLEPCLSANLPLTDKARERFLRIHCLARVTELAQLHFGRISMFPQLEAFRL